MSSLLEQMLMDMELLNYSYKTIKTYKSHIKAFLNFFDKDPEELDEDDIRKYLYYCKTEKKHSPSNLSQGFSAIKFLYRATLKMPITLTKLRGPRRTFKLPVVLSQQEVIKILGVIENLKHKTILMTIYSAGLRVSEATHLKICDIDSQRMQIRVEQGKGKKDRYTLLSKVLLEQLRDYWCQYRPKTWLFPSTNPAKPINVGTIQKVFKSAKKKPISKNRPQSIRYAIVLPPTC